MHAIGFRYHQSNVINTSPLARRQEVRASNTHFAGQSQRTKAPPRMLKQWFSCLRDKSLLGISQMAAKLGLKGIHKRAYLARTPGYSEILKQIQQNATLKTPIGGIELLPLDSKGCYPKGKLFIDGIPRLNLGKPGSYMELTGMNVWLDAKEATKRLKDKNFSYKPDNLNDCVDWNNRYNLYTCLAYMLSPEEAAKKLDLLKEHWVDWGIYKSIPADKRQHHPFEQYDRGVPRNADRNALIGALAGRAAEKPGCFMPPEKFFIDTEGSYRVDIAKKISKPVDDTSVGFAAVQSNSADMRLLMSLGYLPCHISFSCFGVPNTKKAIDLLVKDGQIPPREETYEKIINRYSSLSEKKE